MTYRISIDSGGTFTDGVAMDGNGKMVTAKAHTTPQDQTIGTMKCFSKLASEFSISPEELLEQTNVIVLGTTLATNLIISKNGAKLGVITTKGYKDRMLFLQVAKGEIGGDIRQSIDELMSYRMDPPEPLTRRYLITEVEERVNFKGEALIPLNEDEVRKAVLYLKEQNVESIAVILLFSQLNPTHEKKIEEIIKDVYPGVTVALSSCVLPITGEVGRWSATMISAYVAPKTVAYIKKLENLLEEQGFKGQVVYMQSNGGVASSDLICENPAKLLISGPAAAPLSAHAVVKTHEIKNVVSVDMGGTSFDVCAIQNGQVSTVQSKIFEGMKYYLPCIDIITIGAGGGSIAWIDPGGILQVGPKSAGAIPGPACYGTGGTEPTVTDADVVLGYINPGYFLGGETKLRKDLSEQVIRDKIANPLNLDVPHAAVAIYNVVNAKMAGTIRIVFSRRGFDPRDFYLCSAGGAASVHSARIIEELGINGLIIPKVAPVYCAFGMMYADLKQSFTRPYVSETAKTNLKTINALFDEMQKEALSALEREKVAEKDIKIVKTIDMRYYGQVREQNVEVPDVPITEESLKAISNAFHKKHHKIIGYSDEQYPTEIIKLHLDGIGIVQKPILKKGNKGGKDASKALKGTRPAFFEEYNDFVDTNVYEGDKVSPGNILKGPCIIEEKMTTIVIPPKFSVEADEFGNYITLKS